MEFNKLIPELSVTDINVSKDFYERLGFRVIYERTEHKFAFLELLGNQIMIEEVNDNWNTAQLEYPFGRGINISMTVSDIDSYYQCLLDNGIKMYKEIMVNEYRVDDKIYRDTEFLVQDPDGYLLRFNN